MNINRTVRDRYDGALKPFKSYWKVYGGWRSYLKSPYLHLALLLTLGCSGVWYDQLEWIDMAISAMPAMMAFSLSGIAFLLAFGNDDFRKRMAMAGKENSAFVRLAAAFFHFILFQGMALFFVLLLKGFSQQPPVGFLWRLAGKDAELVFSILRISAWGLGFALFVYGMLCGLAAAAWVYTCVEIYSDILRKKRIIRFPRKKE